MEVIDHDVMIISAAYELTEEDDGFLTNTGKIRLDINAQSQCCEEYRADYYGDWNSLKGGVVVSCEWDINETPQEVM
jgi:hypothetical protein